MGSRLNPYVNVLDGKAREALDFYQSVLGGELNVMTFGDMGTEGPLAAQVMHGHLEVPGGLVLMGADAPPEMVQVTFGDNVSVSLSGGPEDAEVLRGWFAALEDFLAAHPDGLPPELVAVYGQDVRECRRLWDAARTRTG